MKIEKLKKLNKKISVIIETVEPEEGLNAIERDLILSYLLKMYEIIKKPTSSEPEAYGDTPMKHLILENPQPTKYEENPVPPVQPSKEEAELIVQVEAANSTLSETISLINEVETEQAGHRSYQNEISVLEELLASTDNNSDLSEKLRMRPITDIMKAMSINERIFTINELFGGNSERFTHIIGELNQLKDFEQAKHLLAEKVFHEYGWEAPAKAKKIKHFLVLVKRRYLPK